MSLERPQDFYGSDEMSAAECLQLAREYDRAAQKLKEIWCRRKPQSRAPFRFTAIHSIELYLTAYLLKAGEPWVSVRGMGHNLQQRYERAATLGLVLKKQTIASLQAISDRKEYLRSRYAAKEASSSQLTSLEAAVKRVADKVTASFERH